MKERETYGVTPAGGNDTDAMRRWIERTAKAAGWTELKWSSELDQHSLAMGRLTGVRPGGEL